MRAAIFHAPGNVAVEDRPLPEPGPGEVRLRMVAATLCASDVRVYRGEKHAQPGVIPGHEIAGVVDAIGERVEGIAEGDRVIVCPIVACGHCRFCLLGRRNRCINRVFEPLPGVGLGFDFFRFRFRLLWRLCHD